MNRMTLQVSLILLILAVGFPIYSHAQEIAAPLFREGDSWQFKIDQSRYTSPVQSSAFLIGTYEVSFRSGEFKTF